MTTATLKANKGKSDSDISALVDELLQAKHQIERLLQHAQNALRAAPAKGVRQPRPSALDHLKEVMAVTEDLRTASGNLAADRLAKVYGVSLSQLADWLGRSRQAVAKTPDADSLQQPLAFFGRIARLRAVVSPDGFRKWLRMPNESLDGKQPLELLPSADRQVLADLVDDMLTGSPG